MEKEIMTNEEIVESVGEVVTEDNTGLKIAGGIGVAVLVGMVAYKYGIKPIIAKIKAKDSELVATSGRYPWGLEDTQNRDLTDEDYEPEEE
jgi:hypothetical protein